MSYKNAICFGVAGNFAGHLEQAGEAADFSDIKTEEENQPKAIFPFYVPSNEAGFLATYPISNNTINFPQGADNLQIEPELAVICKIEYDDNHKVTQLIPHHFTAYNDCSIRRPNANKIAEKKNWGENSKGLSSQLIEIDSFDKGSKIDDYRIASFHKRDGKLNIYGIDSAVRDYSYFHTKLLDWIIDRMNNQPNEGPMHNIPELLKKADYPTTAVIGVGATRYTEYGETHFLQPGDTSLVVVYNGKRYTPEQVIEMAHENVFSPDVSALIQKVE